MYNVSEKSVELVPAFLWTCPECGVDKFERAIVVELSAEEMDELRQDHGVQPWETGNFLNSPKNVTCDMCKQTFATVDFNEED